MFINIDVKSLEVVVAAFLSQDQVLYRELRDGLDLHADNQKKFGLPDRVTAKVFIFKLLYGAQEYGFAQDSDFTFISTNPKFWRGVIDKFYTKYPGIKAWHDRILTQVGKHGKMLTPFGRRFEWDLMSTGEWKLPSTQIKNYCVQGSGADVVMMARVSLFKRLKQAGIHCKLVSTVHDSIVIDCESKWVDEIVAIVKQVFKDLPDQINNIFGIGWDLEVKVEIQVGHDLFNMKEI